MKCLVTGATGFLGANMVHELVRLKWKVRAFGLPGSNAKYIASLPVEIAYGDVTDPADVGRAVKGVDAVFHIAGDTSWWRNHFDRQRRINTEGPVNVAEACLKHGVKTLVHTSTVDALGYFPGGIADESWPDYNYGGTGYNYADTKREGERRVKAFNGKKLKVVVIYPGSMMGPFDFTLQYGRLFFDLRDGKVPACPPGGASFAHVRDVAGAHIAAVKKGRGGEGYICAGENITYRDLFEKIAQKFGKHAPGVTMPPAVFTAYGHICEAVSRVTRKPPEVDPGMARYMSVCAFYDSAKAARELGYCVTPVQAMIDDAFAWYRENGFL